MGEVLIPTWINPDDNGESYEWVDDTTQEFRPRFGPGPGQRQSYGGHRLRMRRRHHACRAEERAILATALANGREDVLRTTIHSALRGSFPATELLTNNTFANGTTGWGTGFTEITRTVADRVFRATRNSVTATMALIYQQSVPVTQYAPHVWRVSAARKRYSVGLNMDVQDEATTITFISGSGFNDTGLKTLAFVPHVASVRVRFIDSAVAGLIAGDFVDFDYTSVSRCMLADGGSNLLLQSDEFDTSWTATRSSVDDQTAATLAPDGNSTADSIIEDSTPTNTHIVSQNVTVSSTVLDYAFAVALKAGARTWARIVIVEATGGSAVSTYVNLSTGALGTLGAGANWSNARAFSRDMGNGWYYVCIVGRKTNAATTLTPTIFLATADNTVTYTGDGTSNIYAWRATLAQSSLPTRLIQTTTTAQTATPFASGTTAIYVKGLPASTNALLLPFAWVEINGELKQVTTALNSDAAGLGYLQFKPALVRAVNDNDPIIVLNPMGKFLPGPAIRGTQRFTTQSDFDYELEHIYE